ncbi:hypothetical protein F2Q70_00030088 [Brassica cretica]|nr:hypothetical protein F2Q70_00030088 [Brassica cretica]
MVQRTRDAIVFGPVKHETVDEPVDVLVEPADDVNMDDPLDNGAKDRWTNLAPPPLLSPAASPSPPSVSVDQSWINRNPTSSTPYVVLSVLSFLL